MKNKNLFKKLFSIILAAALLSSAVPFAFAEDEPLRISSKDDILALEKNCRLNGYSKNKKFVLTADIDLGGMTLDGIASFEGQFDGQGHTISNFKINDGSEACALFRYLEKDGLLANLTVNADLEFSSDAKISGGIAAVNFGTIDNCIFKGSINAKDMCGGIVGFNSDDALIRDCTNSGAVVSTENVGGIAGKNLGRIIESLNKGPVNNDSSWVDEKENFQIEGLTSVNLNFEAGKNIGGICGSNSGLISDCMNTARVGYLRSGENVGGIAGIHDGYICSCVNEGIVKGKNDVGGIAGQFVPFVEENENEAVRPQVNRLHDLIDKTIDDFDDFSDTLSTDVNRLTDKAGKALDAADGISDRLVSITNDNVDALNDLSQRADYVVSHLPDAMDELTAALDYMLYLNADLKRVKNDLDIYSKMSESEHDPSKDRRVSLLNSVGGSLSVSNINPAQGTEVSVTAKPDKGYVLDSLKIRKHGQTQYEDVTAQTADGRYSFVMPEENVVVSACFAKTTDYLAKSNPGGKLSISESDAQVSIKIACDDGYDLEKLLFDGIDITASVVDGEAVADKPASPGDVVYAEAVFEKRIGANPITVNAGQGGSVVSDMSAAAAGETVTLTVNTLSSYRLNSLKMICGGTASDITEHPGEKTYTFVMPSGKVNVEASFEYLPDADTKIYTQSSPGGSINYINTYATSDYILTITENSGYELQELVITDSASVSRTLLPEDLEETGSHIYRYTLDLSNYTAPVKADALFAESTADGFGVTCVSNTGGRAAASADYACEGDEVIFSVINDSAYMISSFVVCGEEHKDDIEKHLYSYTVPSGFSGDSIDAAVVFEPVCVRITSNTGGRASYSVNGEKAVITAEPLVGYTLSKIRLADADGAEVVLQKQYADSFVYEFEPETDRIYVCEMEFEPQSDKQTTEDAKKRIENGSDSLAAASDSAGEVMGEIENILKDDFGNMRDPAELSDDEINQLEELVTDLFKDLTDAMSYSSQMISDLTTISRIVSPYIDDASQALDKDLDKALKDANYATIHLERCVSRMSSIIDYLDGLDAIKAKKFDDDFKKDLDELSESLSDVNDILSQLSNDVNVKTDKLESDLRQVNDQITKLFNLLLDYADNLEELINNQDIYVDNSYDERGSDFATVITGCENKGAVDGCQNSGGIAGLMDVERSERAENGNISIGRVYNTAAVLSSCCSSGYVGVKNSAGGGIAGYDAIGYICGCFSEGCVYGENANYIGGIAGLSDSRIDNSSSMAELLGREYVGGIAGNAEELHGCLSLVSVLSCGSKAGAILGADIPENETDISSYRSTMAARLTDNYYCSGDLYGIDGVSYVNCAEPVLYEDLILMKNAPAQFSDLRLIFFDTDNLIIRQTPLKYAQAVDDIDYPVLYPESGYISWVGYVPEKVCTNVILRANQLDSLTVIESEEKAGSYAAGLISGDFNDDVRLVVRKSQAALPAAAEGRTAHAWDVSVENYKVHEGYAIPLRLYAGDGGSAEVYGFKDGSWERVSAQKKGRYVEIMMYGESAVYCVVSDGGQSGMLLFAAAAGLLVVAAGAAVLIARKKAAAEVSNKKKHK